MTMQQAFVEVRSQHSKGGNNGKFGGPDTYVAVQVVPAGVAKLSSLNRKIAAKRGIKIIYCGEGYSGHDKTERSGLGAAKAKAKRIAADINRPLNAMLADEAALAGDDSQATQLIAV
jgi:hypothetical protein